MKKTIPFTEEEIDIINIASKRYWLILDHIEHISIIENTPSYSASICDIYKYDNCYKLHDKKYKSIDDLITYFLKYDMPSKVICKKTLKYTDVEENCFTEGEIYKCLFWDKNDYERAYVYDKDEQEILFDSDFKIYDYFYTNDEMIEIILKDKLKYAKKYRNIKGILKLEKNSYTKLFNTIKSLDRDIQMKEFVDEEYIWCIFHKQDCTDNLKDIIDYIIENDSNRIL
ncbi:hypothetical protein M0Q50_02180 [bacterium]|jgi:hypothetical protein|nr:hypothetical protein [bacterium]